MKQFIFVLLTLLCYKGVSAQTDTIPAPIKKKDTIRIGSTVIILNRSGKGATNDTTKRPAEFAERVSKFIDNKKYSTSLFNIDLGLNNVIDNTAYPTTGGYVQNGLGKTDFRLKSGKSIHVRFWVIGQKRYLYKKNVALKYAIGAEYINLRYKNSISYRDPATANAPSVFLNATETYSKNKLGLTYITVPLMMHFNLDPKKSRLRFGAGVSGGYLISARNKQVGDTFGKRKNKGDFDLNKFKASAEVELGFSIVKLYGNYSLTKLHNAGLEQQPYALGIRIGSW